jgi:hypothetical protein
MPRPARHGMGMGDRRSALKAPRTRTFGLAHNFCGRNSSRLDTTSPTLRRKCRLLYSSAGHRPSPRFSSNHRRLHRLQCPRETLRPRKHCRPRHRRPRRRKSQRRDTAMSRSQSQSYLKPPATTTSPWKKMRLLKPQLPTKSPRSGRETLK